MQLEGALIRRRSFSFALATIIVLAQAVGLYSIVRSRTSEKPREVSEAAPITVLNLTSPRAVSPDSGPIRDAVLPPLRQASPITVPSVDLAVAPPTQLPFDPFLGALRDLECTALYGDKTAPTDRGRCAGVQRSLANILRPKMDEARARKFARDKAVQEAPAALPCFGGGGVSLPCLIGQAISGDFEMGTYASGPTPGAQSPPQRGAAGIPRLDPGLHPKGQD